MRQPPASKRVIAEIIRRYAQRDERKQERKQYTMLAIGARYDMVSSTVNRLGKGYETNNFEAGLVAKIRADYDRGIALDVLILQDRAKNIAEDFGMSPRNVEKIWAKHRVNASSVDLPLSKGYHWIFTKRLSKSPGPFVTYY
jgi:hypothetical protein